MPREIDSIRILGHYGIPSFRKSAGFSWKVKVINLTNQVERSVVIVWATTPSPDATQIAVYAEDTNKVGAFAYETGTSMVGMNAQVCRSGFYFYRNKPAIVG